ncbi:MAG: glycosyltransferase family 2 protein [Gaiellaceae bacterium]|nr:glycosyltransferase family 2 protein [Gaiellaceae bacterium]
MSPEASLAFDLVVATVDRVDPLETFLGSLERQTHRALRVLVVDQNEDDRLEPLLARHRDLGLLRLRSPRGLSRARNAALPLLSADLVAFPDDDCAYADDLLERVAACFASEPSLDGLSGRGANRDGRSSPSWKPDPALLDRGNLWNRAASYGLFLRRELVERVGLFDERLGLGAPEPWSSGEEIDYLLRALATGARIAYDPTLVVWHEVREDDLGIGYRDGASVGYLLRKHRYGPRTIGRMLVRPVGGAAVALGRGDAQRARYHLAALRGRVHGYLRGPQAW